MNAATRVSGRGWMLFATMSVVWGITYLFISEAVESYSPAAVVSARTLIGALVLLPIAIDRKALRPALRVWPWVLVFGAVEMAGPFFLLSSAEQTLPSGLTGLLVSTVPLWAAIIGFVVGDRALLTPVRLIGLLVGFGGVAVIVAGQGVTVADPGAALVAVTQVLVTAVMYAIVPFVIATKLRDVPSLGSVTLGLAAVGIAYLPVALLTQHEVPTVRSTVSLLLLGVVCTAVAFVAFFALIGEVGPVRAPLFTYVNPVVAIALGAIVLAEPLTLGLLVGFPLVLLGCWLAATGGRVRRRSAPIEAAAEAVPGAVVDLPPRARPPA
ncbi:DMT family transporter [Microbacterium luticocti]|uniref:DMT family transporter n=1 Tax=Microbacterium luticocti TaxID=451764 RepID=UPI000414E219|nr:DMT family transporter [Microbacterium luticocti]